MKEKSNLNSRKLFGDYGEQLVVNFLCQNGYTILALKYLLHRNGEIDIIAKKDNIIIFVEVKTRSSDFVGIDKLISEKQKRCIIKIALYYCLQNNIAINGDKILRFDVAFVCDKNICYYENAFCT